MSDKESRELYRYLREKDRRKRHIFKKWQLVLIVVVAVLLFLAYVFVSRLHIVWII